VRRILALLACLALVGCGDAVEKEQTIDADANAISAAAERSSEQDSARVTILGTLQVNGVDGISKGEGLVDFEHVASSMSTEVKIAGQTITARAVLADGSLYMKLPPQASAALPAGKQWAKIDLGEALGAGDVLSPGTVTDPASYLKLLQGSGDVRTAGTETIAGRRTTHYTATIDYRELADSGPDDVRELAEQSLRFSVHPTLKLDVWVDGAGLIRRQVFPIETKPINGAPGQKQTLMIDYVEYGVDTSSIQAPPADITQDITDEVKDRLE
jgi:hypothetical protein